MKPNPEKALLAAAEALLEARENQMVTAVEWRALRNAVRAIRRARRSAPAPKERPTGP